MRNWFNGLQTSEQRLLVFGGALVLVVFFWLLVYQPLVKSIDERAQTKLNLERQWQEMQSMRATVSSTARQSQPFPSNVTFSSWVDQQLNQQGLQELVSRTEPVNNSTLTVWLDNVAFDRLIDWLDTIYLQHGVLVEQIDINVTDASMGYTDIRMRLHKP